jgi:hypothetical protein
VKLSLSGWTAPPVRTWPLTVTVSSGANGLLGTKLAPSPSE